MAFDRPGEVSGTQTESPSPNWNLNELYQKNSSDLSRSISKDSNLLLVNEQQENSGTAEALTIAGLTAGVLAAAFLGRRFLASSAERAVKEAGKIAVERQSLQPAANSGLLRDFEGALLPNVERPFLQNGIAQGFVERTREAYAQDLIGLWTMPRKMTALADDTLPSFAERALKQRAGITGERILPETIGKEIERLGALNAGLSGESKLMGKTLITTNEQHLLKLAEDTQFKHIPQIGQFLKATGKISEETIETALKIQKSSPAPAPRIGEILVNKKLAAQADVDAAFGAQQELKDILKELRLKFIEVAPK